MSVATGCYDCNFNHLGFHRPRTFMEMMIPLSLKVYQFQSDLENVPPKKVFCTFDSKRVCVA